MKRYVKASNDKVTRYLMKISEAAWGEDTLNPALSVLSLNTGKVEGFDVYGDYADVSFLGSLKDIVSGLIHVYESSGVKIVEKNRTYFCYDNEGSEVKVSIEESEEASTYSDQSTGFFVSVENIM